MVNLKEVSRNLSSYFSPKIVGEVNNQFIKVAKIKGQDIPWHNHELEDEAFYILEGELLMEIEGQEPFKMTRGDLYIVGKGINHRVSSEEECSIMLVEPKSTEHTGKVVSDITKSIEDQMK